MDIHIYSSILRSLRSDSENLPDSPIFPVLHVSLERNCFLFIEHDQYHMAFSMISPLVSVSSRNVSHTRHILSNDSSTIRTGVALHSQVTEGGSGRWSSDATQLTVDLFYTSLIVHCPRCFLTTTHILPSWDQWVLWYPLSFILMPDLLKQVWTTERASLCVCRNPECTSPPDKQLSSRG